MKWMNEPQEWKEREGGLVLRTDAKTDFWRITHDGGVRDNGHFFYETISGDVVVTTHLEGDFSALYDHAGLMIRIDEKHWIKCGIEYFEGAHCRSVVVTREYSDWSIVTQGPRNSLWVRVKISGVTAEISVSEDGEEYVAFRQAYFPASPNIQVGYMAASPSGDGFEVRFSDFSIQ
jgi:hypothetical protein